jgi:hypothetical protein
MPMTTRTTSRIALLGIALGMILIPMLSREAPGRQLDTNAAAEAKAQAGREALSHPVTDPPDPKTAGAFITLDVPGAGTGFFQGTFPASINQAGDITGNYVDANSVSHSFVRFSNGTITTFDVPGGTFSSGGGINPAGAIAGSYVYLNDPNSVPHLYLRTRNGAFSTFDVPGNVVFFFISESINPARAITGTYWDYNFVYHGFWRTSEGSIATIDAPGADTNPNDFPDGTQAVGINPEGVILGIYTDTNMDNHGFLRGVAGDFTTFDPPGQINTFLAAGGAAGAVPNLYMNPKGVITGTYFQLISGNPFGGNYRVFVRAADGSFTTFDGVMYPNGNPSLNIPCCTWSFPSGITPSGAITGSFNDGFTINHGFLRARDGTLTTFDAPGAGNGFNQGTVPVGITPDGVIMGVYIDANYGHHGFLFFPRSCC